MKATSNARVTARQIEAARRAITRHLKRAGRVWIRIFPDMPVSKKPAEVRMGKGKGSVEYWVAPVKAGRIMFEIDGVPGTLAAGGDPARRRQAAAAHPVRRRGSARRSADEGDASFGAKTRDQLARSAAAAEEGAVQPCAFRGRPGSSRTPPGFARCGATSRGSRPSSARRGPRAGRQAEGAAMPRRVLQGTGGQRQGRQDDHRARRSARACILCTRSTSPDRRSMRRTTSRTAARPATSFGSGSAGRSPSASAGRWWGRRRGLARRSARKRGAGP